MAAELVQLADDVAAWFATPPLDTLGVSVVYGRKHSWRQNNQGTGGGNRIVFAHGEPTGGKAGLVIGETRNGNQPRNLLTVGMLGFVEVWAVDRSTSANLQDERRQVRAAWALTDYALTAIRAKVRTDFRVTDPEWVVEPNERLHGAMLRFRIAVDSHFVERKDVTGIAGGELGFSFTSNFGSEPGCEHDVPPPDP